MEGDRIEKMYLPEDKERGIFVQDDGYPDKVLGTVDDIPVNERPINQHWSWDRILRSCYIKQSDVLLGLFLDITEHFDRETIRRNFRFYEPLNRTRIFSFAFRACHSGCMEYEIRKKLTASSCIPHAWIWTTTTRCTKACTSPVWLEVGKSIVRGFAGMKILDGTTRLHSHHSRSMGQLYFQSKFPQLHLTDESRKTRDKNLSFRGI